MPSTHTADFSSAALKAIDLEAVEKVNVGLETDLVRKHVNVVADAPEIRIQDKTASAPEVNQTTLAIVADGGVAHFRAGTTTFAEGGVETKGDVKFQSSTGDTTHMIIKGDSKVGVGTNLPRSELDINGTGAVIVPTGTSAERPSTGINGMLRYNSDTGYFETYTVSGWGSLATPPSIASFTPTVVNTGTSSGTQITVTGSFFDQNSSIKLKGSDGTEYSTTGFSFTSTTSISATLPYLPSTNSPYTVIVTTGSSLSTESTTTLVSNNNTPVWSSPAAGATVGVYTGGSTTITLSVTDADGDTLTYSIVSGTLPSGITLSGNQISGTSTAAVGSTSTITVRASDGDLYADRTFTIETIDALYAFTSHTFTNAGQTGRTGPTLTQLRNAYTPSWTDNTNYLNVTTQGIQEWTVPITGTYEIDAYGASGGAAYIAGSTTISYGGRGARMRGRFSLSKSNTVYITVGQKGVDLLTQSRGGGGGGGTFVQNSTNLLIAAGGGGGSGKYEPRPASADANHNSSSGNAGETRDTSYDGLGGNGGTGGGGGSGSYYSGGGAGFFNDGGDSTYTYTAYGGSGGPPGEGGQGTYYNSLNFGVDGGFGGGGGNYAGGGGGAGYSGGGAGGWGGNGGAGGGGGSYMNSIATDTLSELSTENSHGKVVITFIE